ncbi:hypothetical protein NEOLI_004907 [Neolecta irregularis DAH-3]|uniref:Uncharacterized protein n=1 Tax=Neolecta irregularis (strain DAH-3) TaxID=1198029 RepID=A0A1U7LRP0_NEOID|nr:hypothetical protein NEOLI_004907 [Neolecta irregularis DAH-3]|eukprot:OLL25340.1 hypothetical protein NEOLI_004907 [Neolecta irregularis DAH-3]
MSLEKDQRITEEQVVYKAKSSVCTHAYGVRHSLLSKLIELSAPRVGVAIDIQAFTDPLSNKEYTAYAWIPPVFNQRPLTIKYGSTVQGEDGSVQKEDRLVRDDWRRKNNHQFPLDQSTAHATGSDYWIGLEEEPET